MLTPALPTLSLAKSVPDDTTVIVVGYTRDGDAPVVPGLPGSLEKAYTKKFGQGPAALAEDLGAKAKPGTTTLLPSVDGARLLVVGLGEGAASLPDLRSAAATGVRAARAAKATKVAVALAAHDPETVRAVAEGALLGSYSYAGLVSATEPATAPVEQITVVADAKQADGKQSELTEQVAQAAIIAGAQLTAREWVNTPANLLYPETFAEEAVAHARRTKMTAEVLSPEELAEQGYGGITAVGGGSSHLPRLTRLEYAPRNAKSHLVLVGKGITFDAGGLDLKTPDGMYTMKSDMAGAAAVIAATVAIAELGLKVRVTAYLPMAENLPSDTAFRPSDVLTMFGGTTVENGNTDAEGRLVMADALARANADEPDLVVDVATLTGACMVALGLRTFGIFSDSDEVTGQLQDAAEAAGESGWPLPMPAESGEELESKVADLKSTGGRYAGASTAAAFLRRFVDPDTAWAHLDIAGPSFTDKAQGENSPGGTGVGVRTLVELARALQG